MTSATPAPAAWGAQLTTIQVEPNTSAMLYAMLNIHATPMFVWPTRNLRSSCLDSLGISGVWVNVYTTVACSHACRYVLPWDTVGN